MGFYFYKGKEERAVPGESGLSMEPSRVSLLQLGSIVGSGVKPAPPPPSCSLTCAPSRHSPAPTCQAPARSGEHRLPLPHLLLFYLQSTERSFVGGLDFLLPPQARLPDTIPRSRGEPGQASAGPFILLVLLADFSSLF